MERLAGYKSTLVGPNPTPADVRRTFDELPRIDEELIREHYDAYLCGNLRAVVVHKLPTMELLHSSDIHVCFTPATHCHCRGDPHLHDAQFTVERVSRENARNFMGYEVRERYVFKGQRRLVDEFLAMTTDLLPDGQLKMVHFQPEFVQNPLEGHNPGLEYRDFADYVEYWTCAVMLRPGTGDALKLDNIATMFRVSPGVMYGRQSFGVLVPVSDEEQESDAEMRSEEMAAEEHGGALEAVEVDAEAEAMSAEAEESSMETEEMAAEAMSAEAEDISMEAEERAAEAEEMTMEAEEISMEAEETSMEETSMEETSMEEMAAEAEQADKVDKMSVKQANKVVNKTPARAEQVQEKLATAEDESRRRYPARQRKSIIRFA
ncbi:hypothetical protein E4U53_000484 [Claviceps sorghi]|nr:hypothetical protein E4U53_000484 [Claviceps sorghi]